MTALAARLISRLALAAFLAAGFGMAGATAAEDAADRQVVHCLDPERQVVTRRVAGDCAGRIISAEEAAAVKARRADRVRRALEAVPPPVAPGRKRKGIGSGFFVRQDGLLLTNNHVVDNCAVVSVETPAGDHAKAEVLDNDITNDLALLSAEVEAPAAAVFDFASPSASGNRIATVGYPSRGMAPIRPVLTGGLTVSLGDSFAPVSYLPIRAEVRPGNSGGPLIDRFGRVVGVIVAKINTSKIYQETGRLVRGLGFAVNKDLVQRFLDRNDVDYAVADGGKTPVLTEAELLEAARRYVARISCWR